MGVRRIDLQGVVDKDGFMDRCAAALGLPSWFGRNWDALADALGDPGQLPDAPEGAPLVVVVTGWAGFAERQPGQWETAREVFAQASAAQIRVDLGGSSKEQL
ncbi:barstar family protein [Streptomyces sp. NPDC102384]|uniref:barstar family protein n=1 Tax=Streptomyces sp. NPDC102384 TaxID=3366166 RepID=UPI0038100957